MSKFYEKFTPKSTDKKDEKKASKKKETKSSEKTQENSSPKRKEPLSSRMSFPKSKKSDSVFERHEMFSWDCVPSESKKIIENFDDIVAGVRNLSGKQKVSLYGAIKNLSHQLTDDRSSRRLGYMNEACYISAYISYFMWWNLVRQVSLFSNLKSEAFDSLLKSENPVAIDVGSGTLTLPIAIWLSRPELRSKKITWYCLDLSQTALSAGEDLYLSIAAKTIRETRGEIRGESGSGIAFTENRSKPASQVLPPQGGTLPIPSLQTKISPWKIVRVKGALGTSIKEKADFVTCANVFNEIIQNNEMPTDFLAKKYTTDLLSYLKDEKSSVLLVEPGDPHSARFISLVRDALIRKSYYPVAPCPHSEACPMAGRTNGKTTNAFGKNSKWCNFAFDTDSAPEKLISLSKKAGLQKERAGLSFIFSKKLDGKDAGSEKSSEQTSIRIASDFIRLPDLHRSGYYACSQFGLLLAVDDSRLQPKNGELLSIKTPKDLGERDKKSGALIVRI